MASRRKPSRKPKKSRKTASTLKRTKKALSVTELFLNSIVENIPDMIFVKDAKDLRFVRFNKAGEDLLGYKREHLIGKNDYDFFPKDEADFFTRKDREVLAGGKVVEILEEPIETRLKGLRILHTKKLPILDQKGRPAFLLGISEDITEKKHLQSKLMENSKLAAVGRIAAGIAHEIRNPLFGIATVAQIISQDSTKPEIRELAQSMMEEVERLKTLLNDLLLYARPRKPSLAVVRPKKLCEEVFKLYRSALESKGLKVMSCYSPEEAEVRIDPDQMRQVFTNLCLNAFQASSEGGVIEVESLVEPAGGKWVFRVTNAGIPIPPRTLPFIFEPFFTTRSEGTGLGLAISRRIVEDHGGSLHVESDAKHGTTFTIEIPL